jgi:hypothetical protein
MRASRISSKRDRRSFKGTMQDIAPEAYLCWDPIDVKKNPQTAGKGSKA